MSESSESSFFKAAYPGIMMLLGMLFVSKCQKQSRDAYSYVENIFPDSPKIPIANASETLNSGSTAYYNANKSNGAGREQPVIYQGTDHDIQSLNAQRNNNAHSLVDFNQGPISYKFKSSDYVNSAEVESRIASFLIEQVQSGSANAAYDLSKRYASGNGVPANINEAGRYLFIACQRGSNEAQADVNKIIGDYVLPNDGPQAVQTEINYNQFLYSQLKLGSGEAAIALAMRIKNGNGFEPNQIESQRLLKIAVQLGNSIAIELSGQESPNNSDREKIDAE